MDEGETSQGSVIGGTLLVAGCCIGAGMLGLPLLTGVAGFKPSLLMFVLSWIFMASTGLLLLEVNLWFDEEVNLVTMAEKTLGPIGKAFAWFLFLFLFYSLMVAYIGGSGQLFNDFSEETLPEWVGSLLVLGVFSIFLYFGTGAVDRANRLLMGGLIAAYVLLVVFGAPHVNFEYLNYKDWSAALYVVPPMVISFGYHNLVPSLRTYMHGDVKKLRTIIIVGSSIPLVIYIMWEFVILGLVPVEGGLREALDEGVLATKALRQAIGAKWIVDLAEYFAFFAIITSLLSVALSFEDFLADGLHIKKNRRGKIILSLLTLGPPFVFALLYPRIFIVALSYAGAFGAVVLFGILPALMIWKGRYQLGKKGEFLLPGGKVTLILVILFAIGVFISEIIHQL